MSALLPHVFKAIHIVGIILWLGPTLAGWYYIRAAGQHTRRQSRQAVSKLELWVRRKFITLVNLEHLGLLLLLVGGASMALRDPQAWWAQPWLRYKIILTAAVILPLEAMDIYFTNVMLARALRRLRVDRNDEDSLHAMKRYDRFVTVAVWILGVILPALFWLAIFRPAL